MRKTITLVLGFFLLSGAAWAASGFRYRATSTTTGTDMKKPDIVETEVWVEGPNTKIAFHEVGEANPFIGEGKYLLSRDGGNTLYLVDPVEKTHARFDLDQLLVFAGAVMDSGVLDINVSNHEVVVLESGPGPRMHGYATQYRKYRTTYDLEMKVLGIRRADHFALETELWTVDDLREAGFQAWMRPRKTGFETIDTLMEGEMSQIKGFPFKTVTTTVTEGAKKKKRTSTTTSVTEVNEFEKTNVPNSTFELPADSQEISLMGPPAGRPTEESEPEKEPEEEEEEEKGGFLKRIKKIRKGDG